MRDEIAEAIAVTLLQQIEEYQQYAKGIPVGNLAVAIDDVQYEEGDHVVGIRLTDGSAWQFRLHRVTPETTRSWGHMTPDQRTEAIRSNVQRNTMRIGDTRTGRHTDVAGDRVPSSELIERLARERAATV